MKASTTFGLPARVLHWVMAAMIIAMLFIGVGMVASVSERHALLVAIHKPLGIAVLVLVCVRIVVRVLSKPPALPRICRGGRRLPRTDRISCCMR